MAKKKNMAWEIPVRGEYYFLQCTDNGNKYELYLDGEHLTTVWKKHEIQEDIEQDIRVGGKVCQFVVYDREPDVSVDGVLLGAHEEAIRQERKNRRYDILTGILMTTVGVLAICSYYVLKVGGEEILGGWMALVMAIGFTAWGVWNLIRAVFRKIS